MIKFVDLKLLLFLLVLTTVSGERIKDMIYKTIDGVTPCFRRHNGTHQFGCSSSREGSVGIIHMIENETDVLWLEKNATAGLYTAVLLFSLFKNDIMSRLRKTNKINGVLVVKTNDTDPSKLPNGYSPESTCPNRYSGNPTSCNADKPWNPYGNNFLLEDWPFPIFFMKNDELFKTIKDCFIKYNYHDIDKQNERSLCALEMQSFMYSAVNSETCMRRNNPSLYMNPTRFCDPLGDENIFLPLSPLTNKSESVVIVTAKFDATSLFDGISPGANSAVTGFVTLIATAYYLTQLNATINSKNVLFTLFNGESFDYIGSSKFIYDLKNNNNDGFSSGQLKLDQIKTVIELGQLGDKKLFLHANNHNGNELIDDIKNSLKFDDNNTLVGSIPPASIQSFLREKPNISAVVIASHGKQFVNKYYGGIFDTSETTNITGDLHINLANIAMKLGDSLYKYVTNDDPTKVINKTIVEDLVKELLTCYLEDEKCNLFVASSPFGVNFLNPVFPLYVGVESNQNAITSVTGRLMIFLTSEKYPNMTSQECVPHKFAWLSGYDSKGICIKNNIKYSRAISPAFLIEDYDLKSNKYSTWTESVWQKLSVRMFLKPSAANERLTMTVGGTVAILSFIIVWFVNSKSDILFNRNINDC
ncbi:hypothetical protein HCN44_003702 [Aphidius gifuensis]|uniref:Nicastrin n=1 Tax=Aphidius gifuensis TaxID=684658 RepID=A0A835CKI1_APHGI|nr:nicastrin [Aphidius gifuensis]KAF7987839.1 hypothetical protein HCN44_003702 [Aphidius gifuensis]